MMLMCGVVCKELLFSFRSSVFFCGLSPRQDLFSKKPESGRVSCL